jgi:hypothetical protein
VHLGHHARGIDERKKYGNQEYATEGFEREAYGVLMTVREGQCREEKTFNVSRQAIRERQQAKMLIDQRSGWGVTMEGHADSTGPSDYNKKLSKEDTYTQMLRAVG